MAANERKFLRCAVYTRKSSEHGLEQDFNSLDAQREAAEAYIKSQAHEGWRLLKTCYDDGGLSGGTLERPALQTLLADIRARKVDVVVVYKVDRLTRSLRRFRQTGRGLRGAWRLVRGGHPAVQHHELDGAADAQCAAVVCPVRAGAGGGAHPRQVCGLAPQGHVDGGHGPAGL